MTIQNTDRKIPWLPTLFIAWNLFDIAVHVATGLVEPLRVAGNIVGIVAALIVLLANVKSYAPQILGGTAILVVISNMVETGLHGFMLPTLFFVGVALFLLLRWMQVKAIEANTEGESPLYYRWWMALLAMLVGVGLVALSGVLFSVGMVPLGDALADAGRGPLAQAHDGRLEGADYWREEPMILSGGMGFEGIIGISELTEEAVREADGAWISDLTCTNGEEPAANLRTRATVPRMNETFWKGFVENGDDGLPVVFSWPLATETVDVTDFQFTLNTGEVVFANAAGMYPNQELNERNVAVLFADFGNRGLSSEEDARFPVRLDIVEDDTPLLLIGPGGQEFNAVGLSWETDSSPYDSGPRLVGAKLNFVGDAPIGEGGIDLMEGSDMLPNDEFALYDEGDFRIRVLTTGGFSPDGVTGVRPNMYEQFFRIHVNGVDGETVLLEEVGVEYQVAGGTLRVVGLSELGRKENPDEGIYYDDCYVEDVDNYIDIILVGDEEAARNITFVEIPSLEGGYSAFYNPGGPGPEPFEGVRYTAPGPPDMEPVIIALDDPMRVDRAAH
jgi:hypothetical protein